MFNRLFILIAIAMIGPVAAAQTSGLPQLTAKDLAQGYRDGYVLAKPRADHLAMVDAAEANEGLAIHRKFPRFGGLRILKLRPGDTAAAAIKRLAATGRYEFVEPDRVRHSTTTPNDPDFAQQWALNNTGSNGPGNGIPGADINAVAAWTPPGRSSASGVIVAVVDTGVRVTHTDINGNLWRNPQENLDGYTGDLYGINTSGNGAGTGNPNDDNTVGHGTHVSGILGASGNNGDDISGVAWQVQIMALKFLDSSGSGTTANEITCIDFAISHNANIINASFGSSGYSASEYTAIQSAGNAGIIFVVAAGNVPEDNDLTFSYPASYLLDNIVAVGCSDNRDDLAYFSGYGSGIVDLFAPGYNILSLGNASDTATEILSGTSMSTPMVTGTLALLKAQFPSDTYRQLINRLLGSVDPKLNFSRKAQSGGRLDAGSALTSGGNGPFNDNFANRAHLAGTTVNVRSNNTGATRETGEPLIAGNSGGASLWWDWTAPVTGTVKIATSAVANGTTFASAYGTLVAVYTGTALNSLTPVASNASAGSGTSSVSFAAQAGATYEITVDGQNAATGLTILGLTYANDAFAAPVTLAGASAGVTASNANASREAGEPTIQGNTGGHSLWYQWTPPATGQYQVSVLSPDFDPLLAVSTGSSIGGLHLVASGKGGAISSSAATPASLCTCTFTATLGTTYAITVDGNSADDPNTELNTGQFTLSIADSTWQATAGDNITCAPTVGSDGTVYVGSDDGTFYAFNPNGALKWKYGTGGALDTSSASVSADGATVYTVSEDGYVYALATSNGSLDWRYSVAASPPACAPTLGTDGTIYVKDSGFNLYALTPAGTVKWTCPVPGASYAAPTIGADGIVYLGSDNGTLYAVNPANGAINWTFNAGSPIYTSAAIDSSGNIYFGTLNGMCYAVNPSGNKIWSYQAGSSVTSSPALGSGGVVYFASYDRNLYALSTAAGALQWTYALGAEIRASSPALDGNGIIYVGCYDNNVYAINANGTLNRIFATGGLVRSSPALSGGALYFGSDDHKLYAFNLGTGPAASPWPMYLNNATRNGEAAPATPSIATTPQSQTTVAGGSVTLSVAATGTDPLAYQWYLNGNAIAGATSATLPLASVGTAQAGNYTVIVTNAFGSVTSAAAALAVNYSARLDNLSARAFVGTGGNILIAGFGIGGTGAKNLLLRGVGPTLAGAPYNVAGTLPTPQITLYDTSPAPGPYPIVTNVGWGNASTLGTSSVTVSPQLATVTLMNSVGAFPLNSGSADSALEVTPPTGSYTALISGTGGATGIALAEIYDADTGTPAARLTNLSARTQMGVGGNILIGGFAITGTTSETVLIRGVGPGLANAGIPTGFLAQPQLVLFDSMVPANVIASNSGWGASPTTGPSIVPAGVQPATITVMNSVGAFPLTAGSADAAMVVTLPPGDYTAQVSGVGGTTGIALVEVYEVP